MTTERHTSLFGRVFSRPEGFLAGTFLGLIIVGTILLSLPVAHADAGIGPLDALFTATSAVCVTGLIVVDTGQAFSRFGQTVILVLIQLGGLGIMTFAALVIQVVGHKLSFRSQAALQDVFYQKNAAASFRRSLKWIVLLTLVIEALGALLLFRALPAGWDRGDAAYLSVFHAVSAFCNAGFSTFSESLVSLRGLGGFMTVISLLIIVGGLGYTVILEAITRAGCRLARRPNPVVWSLNTRVVLTTSLFLAVIGALFLSALGLTGNETGWSSRIGNAAFQSITARTAGFNTVEVGRLPVASLLCLAFLMFVGGSPGSCAGGVKTTTLAIWVARLRARLQHQDDVTIGRRRIPVDLVRKTGLLVGVAAVYNLIGVLVLSITETSDPQVHLQHVLFEQLSAFATVGLSTGLTPTLSAVGKLWIIITMFVGRLGPLTIALVVMERKPAAVRLAEERLMIG